MILRLTSDSLMFFPKVIILSSILAPGIRFNGSLLCVGRFIAQGIFESMTKYYPKQQDCAAEVMQQMEQFHVIPDDDFGRRLVKIFGIIIFL